MTKGFHLKDARSRFLDRSWVSVNTPSSIDPDRFNLLDIEPNQKPSTRMLYVVFEDSTNAVIYLADTKSMGLSALPAMSQLKSVMENVKDYIVKSISPISGVLAIHICPQKDFLEIWTVLDSRRRELRDTIFQKELELQDVFPAIDFDFKVRFSEKGKSKDELPEEGITCFAN